MACIQQNGIYAFINAKGGTCLDLSGGDNHSIIGYGFHRGPNQAWIVEKAGSDKLYFLKSVGSGQYLNVDGELRNGQRVVVHGEPYPWRIEDEPGVNYGVRLSPESDYYLCVDLSNHGDSKDGTPIELWGRWEGQNQVWKLQKIE